MTGPALTPLQTRLLNEIAAYWRYRRFSPSIRELAGSTGCPSTSTIARNLRSLQTQGLLTFWPEISRSIVLTDKGWALSGHERPCCS